MFWKQRFKYLQEDIDGNTIMLSRLQLENEKLTKKVDALIESHSDVNMFNGVYAKKSEE